MPRVLFLSILLVAGTFVCAGECRPIDGVKPLLEPGRVLLLGELHGTAQSPAFALDVACHAAAAKLPVVVALELAHTEGENVDRYLSSAGTPEDRERLLAGHTWKRSYQDGRNSRAMYELVEGIRRLRQGGSKADVALFDVPGTDRDRAMGDRLAGIVSGTKKAMTVVLAGNMHSRVTRGSKRNADHEPMGYVLGKRTSPERITALDVAYGSGSAWVCTPECGVQQLSGAAGERSWVIEIDEETRPAGHHGWYHVGAITASEPAHLVTSWEPKALEEKVVSAGVPEGTMKASESPINRPKLEGPLSDAEQKFQGTWQAYDYASDSRTWKMTFDGRDFRAQGGPDDWYVGHIAVDAETTPTQLDFMIEDCRCSFKGMASEGIFFWDGDSIIVAAPRPGAPRPRTFIESNGEMMRLRPLAKNDSKGTSR